MCLHGLFIIEPLFFVIVVLVVRKWFYWSLSCDAFPTTECKTSNLPSRNRKNPTEHCSPSMLTIALAIFFLLGSTKLNLQTNWKSSNIYYQLGSLFFSIIRLGYFRLLCVVFEVTMCIHEPSIKLYQRKTSALDYYFRRLDYTSPPLILFIVGHQKKKLAPYSEEITCSVSLSTLRCLNHKMEHETYCRSIHRSCLYRALTCEKKSPTPVISSFDVSQSFTLTTKGIFLTQHSLSDWEILKCPVNLLCWFFMHCFFFLTSAHCYQIGPRWCHKCCLSSAFATHIVTESRFMELASLSQFRRQTNKLNDYGLL